MERRSSQCAPSHRPSRNRSVASTGRRPQPCCIGTRHGNCLDKSASKGGLILPLGLHIMNEPIKNITTSTHPAPTWEQECDGFAAKDVFIEKLMNQVAFLETELLRLRAKVAPSGAGSERGGGRVG